MPPYWQHSQKAHFGSISCEVIHFLAFLVYAMSKNAVDSYGESEVHTLDQYRTNYGVICHRMCLPGADTRTLAGTDTRGISLQGQIVTTQITAHTCSLFFECTSVLQISQAKQFSVVV